MDKEHGEETKDVEIKENKREFLAVLVIALAGIIGILKTDKEVAVK